MSRFDISRYVDTTNHHEHLVVEIERVKNTPYPMSVYVLRHTKVRKIEKEPKKQEEEYRSEGGAGEDTIRMNTEEVRSSNSAR